MTLRRTLTAGLLLGVSHLGYAWAAEPAGTAAAIRPDVGATGTGGARTLAVDSSVFMGDVIKTGASGTAQIRFVDDTRLAVGPNSDITIDRFIFGGGKTAKQVTINVTQGAFRFLTGISAKSAYSIQTPTATIGVRGTEWEGVYVDGVLKVTLYGGGLTVCNRQSPRRCALLTNACDMITLSPDGRFNWTQNVYEKTKILESDFAFAFHEPRLLPDFRAKSGSCNVPDIAPNNQGRGTPAPEIDVGDGGPA